MSEFVLGMLFSALGAMIIASSWNFDYDDIVVAVEDAKTYCGEEGPKAISLGSNEITCNNGRTISWESPE